MSEEREEVPAFATAVALGGSSGRREKWCGKRGDARREEARAALELGATRGGEGQQEVARRGRKRRAAVL
jgi:hypothetical protein